MKHFWIIISLLLSGCAHEPRWLPRAHAHNDYLHARPLFDALDAGFCSIEADIWLVGGALLVAHDRDSLRPERTLERLYLDPLQKFVRHDGRPITLLIDIKSDAEPTYATLRELLESYRPMLTSYHDGDMTPASVTVLITGNRPYEMIVAERDRLVAIDGDVEYLNLSPPPSLVPQVSVKWDDEARQNFRKLISRAHAQGRRIRFYATPDNPQTWRMLLDGSADLINTDDLIGLRDFFRAESRSRARR